MAAIAARLGIGKGSVHRAIGKPRRWRSRPVALTAAGDDEGTGRKRSELMPLPSAMPISQHQLAAAVLAAAHIVDRRVIAAFRGRCGDNSRRRNRSRNTSAGSRAPGLAAAGRRVSVVRHPGGGPRCLLTSLSGMSVERALVQEILRAGPHTTKRVQPWRWQPDRRCRALRQARLCWDCQEFRVSGGP